MADLTTPYSDFEYFAFISYKREDEKWAKWLQNKLESYSLPTSLRKKIPGLPTKIRPVFRDKSELAGGNLNTEIEKGLKSSKYLIVICSPRSAHSHWVSNEIQYYIDHGRENDIIPFIVDGHPNSSNPQLECFPESLKQLTGKKEILGINIEEMGRDAAAIKVVANMFNLRFDQLWRRFEKAKKKRLITLLVLLGIALVALCAIIFLYGDRNRAYNQIALKNEQLQEAYADIKRANADLEKANDSIIKSKTLLDKSYQDIKVERNKVVATNNLLTKAYDDLTKVNAAVLIANDSLQASRDRYKLLYDDLQVAYAEAKAGSIELMARNWFGKEAYIEAINLIKKYPELPAAKRILMADNDKYTIKGRFHTALFLPDNPSEMIALANDGFYRCDIEGCYAEKIRDFNNFASEMRLSDNGRVIVTFNIDSLQVWDTINWEISNKMGASILENAIVSPNNKTIFYGIKDSVVQWNFSQFPEESTVLYHSENNISNMAVSDDGRLIATTCNLLGDLGDVYSEIKVWDSKKRKLVATIHESSPVIYAIAFAYDNSLFYSTDRGELKEWDCRNRKVSLVEREKWSIVQIICRDNHMLCLLNEPTSARVKVFSLDGDESLSPRLESTLHFPERLTNFDVPKNCSYICGVGQDVGLRILRLNTALESRLKTNSEFLKSNLHKEFRRKPTDKVKVLASNDGERILAVYGDYISLYDESGRRIRNYSVPKGRAFDVGMSGDRSRFVVDALSWLSVFDADGSVLGISKVPGGVRNAFFASSDSVVACVSYEGELRLYSLPDLVQFDTLSTNSLYATPVGKRLLDVNNETGVVRMWDVENHTSKNLFTTHHGDRTKILASDNGEYVAVFDNTSLALYNVATGKEIMRNYFFTKGSYDPTVAFSPDGKYLAAAQDKVMIYDIATGVAVREFNIPRCSDLPELWFDEYGNLKCMTHDDFKLFESGPLDDSKERYDELIRKFHLYEK